ncbi:bifunctional phosphopantothenoylcysteine decarboxylase/phosphopantothenate--cysteine ligase CoaBC [Hominisplanchenecus murintestinalis]|uniref:Bifunctional phosphopantothenoylcysteine decarboxylase/phosphopantothenate--cysteine ligase CoaBC n=1 Tax=Hominisplanchenecus murintestinalis TaxID=2941517 RepID=A0AC61R0U6_9FIRM|nr:bifunctional phosphopantothenoylcysteine decarboxylase/phosphopantothenate--cysteine ligase CoaBC [Hominisplanchenecus murintestinalis]TGX99410.1 bifunctional phosphopantothenoylcysteine decarboxylase/phosphopantothenate--cysteine ligase CoaBC [Hominisplanchenecus murintestinalis]
MLKGKTVILGVAGGIAAYKIAVLARLLVKQNCDVHVIMTQNATNFINPITFETLTNHKCLVDTFDRNFEFHVEHVALAKLADAVLIAPATANIIGKMAHGLADDMLTTTVLACTCPKIAAPAMNTRMYQNGIVQNNIKILEQNGFEIVKPSTGLLACGDEGDGKMAEPETLLDYLLRELACEKDMKGMKVLVTAGPTAEPIDPVRFITNHSTGKMGYALAKNCMLRGADVTLVTGPSPLPRPPFVHVEEITSAHEMFEAVTSRAPTQDIIIKAAAVADYRPRHVSAEKVKKSGEALFLELERTEDILKYLGEHKQPGQFLCGFSMETEHMIENSRQKLARKNLDMIAANNLKQAGAGFGTDTNIITLITQDQEISLELMSKDSAAEKIVDFILQQKNPGGGN